MNERQESPASGNPESYLEPLRSGGETISTDSSFTLSTKSSAERYSLFEREMPGYCLLRIFQGLHALGAKAVSVTTGRNQIDIHVKEFDSATPDWLQPNKLQECLSDNQSVGRALEHVLGAFLSVGGSPHFELSWRADGMALVATGGSWTLFADAKARVGLTVRLERSGWSATIASEHALLVNKMRFHSIPVTLDRRPLLPSVSAAIRGCWYHGLSDAFFLGMAHWGASPPSEWESDFGSNKPSLHSAAFVWYPNPQARHATMTIDAGLESTGELIPVINGVKGKGIDVPQAPGMTIYAEADDLQTDLSGLSIVEVDQLLSEYLPVYTALLGKVRPRLDEISALWTKDSPYYILASGIAIIGSFSGIYVFVVLPIAAVVAGMEALASRMIHANKAESRAESLRAGLAQRIDNLLGRSGLKLNH